MNFNKTLSALAIFVALAGSYASASAATLSAAHVGAGNVFTDYAGPGLVSFDLDIHGNDTTVLEYTLDDDDLLAGVQFSALLRNFLSAGLAQVSFGFSGVRLASVGTVTRSFGGTSSVSASADGASIVFMPREFFDVQIGNPLSAPGLVNWVLDTRGMQAGERFSISVNVPEPSGLMLLAAGLGLIGAFTVKRPRRPGGGSVSQA
jgi:PEP-CTERM motif